MSVHESKPDLYPTPKQQRRYLIRFAKMLENWREERKRLIYPEVKFDMGEWSCKTAACAIGSAALHPYFRKLGLDVEGEIPTLRLGGKIYRGEDVGIPLFGLSALQADWLFYSSNYEARNVQPEHVAKRVRGILAGTAKIQDDDV